MASVNKVILIGYLGHDPEVKFLQDGVTAVCTLSLATAEKWKDKASGEPREKTEWHRVVCWDKLAEIVGQYLHKGSQAYFEGQLETRKYTDKQNVERYTTEVRAHKLVMLGDPNRARTPADTQPARTPARPAPGASSAQDYRNASRGEGNPYRGDGSFENMPDDIPF